MVLPDTDSRGADRVRFGRRPRDKVTAIRRRSKRESRVQRRGSARIRSEKLWGLGEIRIGDRIRAKRGADATHQFPPPTASMVVVWAPGPWTARCCGFALAQLPKQDPLIKSGRTPFARELRRSLYGEVAEEGSGERSASGVRFSNVTFGEATQIYVEASGSRRQGEAIELLSRGTAFRTSQRSGLRVEKTRPDGGTGPPPSD